MDNNNRLSQYADVVIRHAVSLREGQTLFIRGRRRHKKLAFQIGEVGYACGAGEVRYHLVDQEELAQLIRCGAPEHIEAYLARDRAFHEEVIDQRGAFVLLLDDGSIDPRVSRAYRMRPENRSLFLSGRVRIGTDFQYHATKHRLVAGTTVPNPTPSWARRLFPRLSQKEALEKLWEHIYSFALVDERQAMQRQRVSLLNNLAIRTLSVTGGGNDFRVTLSDRARWQGAHMKTVAGQPFYVNFPSEEICTTPDARHTEGRVIVSQALPLGDGRVVKDLVLEFKSGELVSCSAREGKEVFCSWVDAPGGRRLGEFALVDINSPISRSGLFFHLPHLDENAASHIALGHSLAPCLLGSEDMGQDEFEAHGFNHSSIHTDIMFGSPDVSVVATTRRGDMVVVMDEGKWTVP